MSCQCHAHLSGSETLPTLPAMPPAMPSPPPPPLPSEMETAAELCRLCHIRLKPKASELLHDELTPRQYFDLLMEHNCLADARRVLAHALPKRRALWWGCLCALDTYGHEPPQIVTEVLSAVISFIRDPSEANRRTTSSLGWKAKPTTIAGCLAMGAFFSEGSVSLPGLPVVQPRPFVTGRLAGVAVYLASVMRDAAQYKSHLRRYLSVGLDVARGNNLWTNPGSFKPIRLDAGGGEHALRGTHQKPALEPTTLASIS